MLEQNKDKLIESLQSEISALRLILNKMPGNVYWKTKDDHFLGCNDNVAKLFNLASTDEIIGKRGIDLLPANIFKDTQNIDQKVMDAQTEMSLEEIGIDDDGNPAIYLSRKSPLYDGNQQLIGSLGISIDITKQKKAEEKLKAARKKAEKMNRAKSQFLAMISHELRNPLTSILGFATLLQKEKLSPKEQKTHIDYIIQSGTYLLTLISKLLEYSKLEANKLALTPTAFDFKKFIYNIIETLQHTVKENNLPITLEYDKKAPNIIIADMYLLKQILINLLENAIKFTPSGKININISLISRKDTSVTLKIAIQDTGIGIPKNQLKSIFKEFHQINSVYNRNISMMGTGLGLTIVKKLVKILDGKITVDSKMNQGSTFSFVSTFSLPDEKTFNEINTEKKSNPINTKIKKYFALLIEDNFLVQLVHQKMLINLGCQVDIADNGKKALSLIKKDYDIIFVDIGLPDIHGFDLIKEIRKTAPQFKQTPIIALTAFFTDEEKERCIDVGANSVLIKPVSQELLMETLHRHTILKNIHAD